MNVSRCLGWISDNFQEIIDENKNVTVKKVQGEYVKTSNMETKGHNRVVSNNHQTAHGEVSAIRDACTNLGTFDLTGCEIYTTGEPCHMCLCSCMWANIDKVYFGCTIQDNEDIGFRDEKFDQIFGGRDKLKEYLIMVDRDACKKLFDEYRSLDKTMY